MQIKYTAIAAVVLALGAGAAQAKIAQPSTGNGELFFTLYDTRGTDAFDDDKTLVVDLGGISGSGGDAAGRINNWLSDNTTAADPIFSTSKQTNGYTITVLDPKVVAFLNGGSFNDIMWSVTGGDSAGRDRLVTTVNGAATEQFVAKLRSANTGIAGFSTNTNTGPEGDNLSEATNASSLFVGDGGANARNYGQSFAGSFVNFNNMAKVGESMAFYGYWENSATGAGNAKSGRFGGVDGSGAPLFPKGGWKLYGDGSLVYSVPEPETYAMMGVGLLVIGAIARRRRATRA